MLNSKRSEEIQRIRYFLMSSNYDIYYQSISGIYNYFFNPWQTYKNVKDKIKKYDSKTKYLFELLMLGDELGINLAYNYFGKDIICDLINVNFLHKDNDLIRSDGYSIIPYLDRYFVVNLPLDYPTSKGSQDIYIGFDSYKLTNVIPHHKHNNHLDLCSGSGIQCIMAADAYERGIAVEVNKKAIDALKFNISLNELDEKINIINGDLYSKIPRNQKFDIITANPPFLPVPEKIAFPIAGDGGESGLETIHKILISFDNYLNEGGSAIIIGESLGNDDGSFLMDLLYKDLAFGYQGDLFLQAVNSKDDYINSIASFYYTINNKQEDEADNVIEWNEIFNKYKATHVYAFILKIKKLVSSKNSTFNQIRNYESINYRSIPSLNKEYKLINSPSSYFMLIDDKVVATLNKELKDCIQLCDGTHTIEEILNTALKSNGNNKNLSNIFLATCKALSQQNYMNINE